ncbi:MAG: hypothetical protein ACR2ND_06165 [Solirubrobacteraceae bacterium]
MLCAAVSHPALCLANVKLTDWLTASGGVGAFVATAILAGVAVMQMGLARAQMSKLDDQVKAAQEQVDAMRETSAAELAVVREQIDASVEQGRAVRDQVDAAVEQGRAIREAARAQLQPIVFAHAIPVVVGPNDEYSIGEDDVAFAYFLQNEGTGIALNVRHGVEIGGIDYEYGGGMQVRVLRPGESLPLRDAASGQLIWRVSLAVVRRRDELPDGWHTEPRHYWASFESVFGERFETRNPRDPEVPADFKRLN